MKAPGLRPWWKEKRWWVGGVLWLSLSYPVCRGPVAYAAARGWVSRGSVEAIYGRLDRWVGFEAGVGTNGYFTLIDSDPFSEGEGPITLTVSAGPDATDRYRWYVRWWESLVWGPP